MAKRTPLPRTTFTIPGVAEIAEGARRATQKRPRPGRDFFRAVLHWVLDMLEQDGSDPVFVLFAERRELQPFPGEPDKSLAAIRAYLDADLTTEADLRSALVELHVLASEDKQAAQKSWAAILGMVED